LIGRSEPLKELTWTEQSFSPTVLIDEIQYAPELLPYIKLAADHTASTTSSPARFDHGRITVIGPLQPGAPPRSE
jgi:hypothetical protein